MKLSRHLRRVKRDIIARCCKQNKIILTQKDFNSGTYRIRTPGYYEVGERIEFEPIPADEATRTDKPGIGWFAIITIETEYVILDLNGHTVQATQAFLNQHIFNLFSVVELSNSQFPGPQYGTTFGPITTSFTGDTSYVAAKYAIVRNGTCGMSGHFGLHGTNNAYVFLDDLVIRNWEVAGLELHALQYGDVSNVEIIGLEHTIQTRSTAVALTVNESFLQMFIAMGVPGAQAMLTSLEAFATSNPEVFYTPSKALDSTTYGLLMTSGFSRDYPFPMTPQDCVQVAKAAGGEPERHIRFRNVRIHDVFNAPEETVSIGTNLAFQSEDFAVGFINLQPAGLFGILRWSDAYDSSGQFAPNAFLQSYAYILTVLFEQQGQALLSQFPSNMPAINASILSADHAAFLANVIPIFGGNFNIILNKGCFGWRIDCGEDLDLKNIQAYNISNRGAPGMELSQLPDGDQFPQLVQQRYIGNDVWGFEFACDTRCSIKQARCKNITSLNGGFLLGLELRGYDQDVVVCQNQACDIKGYADNVNSVVNPPAFSYGYRILDCPLPNVIKHSWSSNIVAPRKSFGFAIESSTIITANNLIRDCRSWNVVCNSCQELNNTIYNKTALGYTSAGTIRSVFQRCKSQGVKITGEQDATEQSTSVAAGFALFLMLVEQSSGLFILQPDMYSQVLQCKSTSCVSGAGVAAGVYLDTTTNDAVIGGMMKNNLADSTFGQGFGIVDYCNPTTTTIQCVAFAHNSTANVSVIE